ncbi:acyltransferase [Rhizobium sp. 16-449-1b]|uniref:acyltransferase family protein n=1 Tax=Rhizobium sp. 16-449-1b TaxID=2819989 RepID=UPI001AD95780|nr:acyltransferase [Rhizobium sp. 16-449-1b]MBO9194812.1 acyltransferase [Rhizobium sp. 16-449-1b]
MKIDAEEDFHALDALRGGASLVVAIAHAWQVFLYPYSGDSAVFSTLGGAATWSVAVFFLLSGMLIARSIRRRADQGFSLGDYVLARCLRIFPPLVAAVAITVAVVLIIKGFDLYGAESYLLPGDLAAAREKADFRWGQILPTLLLTYKLIPIDRFEDFLSFNGPLWSLSFEFWLYILAGLGASVIFNRSFFSLAAGGFLLYLMFFASKAVEPPFISVAVVWFLGFAIGWTGGDGRSMLLSKRFAVCGLAIAAALAIGQSQTLSYLKAPYSDAFQYVFYWMGSVVLLVGICATMRSKGFAPGMRLLQWAASCSYTLYLVHFPLFMLALSIFRPSLLWAGAAGAALLSIGSFIVVVGISWLLARVVENRALLHGAVALILPRRELA